MCPISLGISCRNEEEYWFNVRKPTLSPFLMPPVSPLLPCPEYLTDGCLRAREGGNT